jgi:hypothetical protein
VLRARRAARLDVFERLRTIVRRPRRTPPHRIARRRKIDAGVELDAAISRAIRQRVSTPAAQRLIYVLVGEDSRASPSRGSRAPDSCELVGRINRAGKCRRCRLCYRWRQPFPWRSARRRGRIATAGACSSLTPAPLIAAIDSPRRETQAQIPSRRCARFLRDARRALVRARRRNAVRHRPKRREAAIRVPAQPETESAPPSALATATIHVVRSMTRASGAFWRSP